MATTVSRRGDRQKICPLPCLQPPRRRAAHSDRCRRGVSRLGQAHPTPGLAQVTPELLRENAVRRRFDGPESDRLR